LTKPRALPVTLAVVVGACWRLWLMGHYAGWEESDYGNLAMIQGVLDGGFLHYDMNHMPGYYALAAMVHALVGDAVIAGRGVSLVGGLVALGLAVSIAIRIGGTRVGWVAAALLVIQPEFALYSASSLREPVAAAFLLGAIAALGSERMRLAGLCAAGAFLVRFDTALVMGPVLMIHALGREAAAQRWLRSWLPLVLTVGLWSLYCRVDHGTWAFWSHAVQVNLDTGLGAEAELPGQWWTNGLGVAVGLLGWLLPWRIGLVVWVGLGVGCWVAIRQKHGLLRTLAIQGMAMLGLWATIGFVGQHAPSHNLYWKWLYPVVPVILPLAVFGLWSIVDRLARVVGVTAALIMMLVSVGQAGVSNLKETERQRQLSESWYRPQLELGQWIEAHVPEATPMVLDNIPACWIRRRPNARPMVSWFDVPVSPGNEAEFAAWVEAEGVEWVLWFREEWTQAPRVAPFLADGGVWSYGGVRLVEQRREDGYGWIFFERTQPAQGR
jgi:hypothetical protein